MKKILTVIQILLIVLLLFLLHYIIVHEKTHQYHQNHFVYYAPQTNQPTCVVGAFCMYANEALNVKLSPAFLETNFSNYINDESGVSLSNIPLIWDSLFPTNRLISVYDVTDANSGNNKIYFDIPYLWIGKLQQYHACLVYLHSNSVTYKHFIYNPYTKTNYIVTTNYDKFFKDTLILYTIPLSR
jgi:hypothetical protein